MNLSGKTVLLTGATGGIGSAIATELSSRGASIIAVGRKLSCLTLLCERLRSSRCDILPIVADLTDSRQRESLVATAVARAKNVDVLINCAGIQNFGFFENERDDQTAAMFAINTVAPIALINAFLPHMRKNGGGRIVNVGSICGSIGTPCFASYSASKFALLGFSQALRRELAGSGIGITYVAPRYTRTAFNPLELVRLAYALKVRQDEPTAVAQRVVSAIESDLDNLYIGWRERLFVRLNVILPRLIDLPLMKRAERMRQLASLVGRV